ncbi:tRNA 2-thiouridine(34) synthase MnmA [candidate division WOR-3 bacterium]|nr:tRNA 2-thiouridine(34) synthase MnmA [candidate division WOR-3 bacterium]
MRVVVAMSGGVDSSVAAALLKEQGYEVIGITMRLYDETRADTPNSSCCGSEAITSARRAAYILNIPFYTIDLRPQFQKQVIEHFITEYAQGRTPNPCLRCNQLIKFGVLREKARHLDVRFIATGHHARLKKDPQGLWHLYRGVDKNKDQSYFLYTLTQEQMAELLLPIGEYTKEEVRELAARFGLPNARRPESQEICFVPDNDYAAFLKQIRPEIFQPGPIYDTGGNLLGEHSGIAHFTIGQRKGLKIAFGERRYVVKIDPMRNAVIIGSEQDVYHRVVNASDASWTSGKPPENKTRVWAKVRYQGTGSWAEVEIQPENRVRVVFEQPQWAPTPGQAIVFWQNDEVLGGATIESSEK